MTSGRAFSEILAAYPYLEDVDVRQALAYAAWRAQFRRKERLIASFYA